MRRYTVHGSLSTIDRVEELVLQESFDRRTVREMLNNQKDTRVIIGLFDMLDVVVGFADLEVLQRYYPLIKEAGDKVKETYGYTNIRYRSLMLVKLLAGCSISEHIDEQGDYDTCHRVHVPVLTSPDCWFTVNGTQFNMGRGDIVEIDNTLPHSVVNNGGDRVHIIFDIEETDEQQEFDIDVVMTPIPEQFYMKEK